MANLSYCRFQNTYKDLLDCYNAMEDIDIDDLSESEKEYYQKLLTLCKNINDDFLDDDED